ncbi:hypothetical protein [Prescottella subtropica]|uniref:hypothetical protein n=1 Tax=Prescottella subtropica TaxID=2545757 RepID=UPI0010F985D0|nr:hypothetical protein [Prescottella subtropica]
MNDKATNKNAPDAVQGIEGNETNTNIHEGEDPMPTIPNPGHGHTPTSAEVLADLKAGAGKVTIISEHEVGERIPYGDADLLKPILVALERFDGRDSDGNPETPLWTVGFVKTVQHDTDLPVEHVPQLIAVLAELYETYQSMTRTVRRDETSIRDAADYREDLS